ncbi:MAG: cytochrome c3 family protein [Ignavibacteriaceae bacterium]
MIKYTFTLVVLFLITSAFFLSSNEINETETIETVTVNNSTSPEVILESPTPKDTLEIPEVLISPSSIGEVSFPHLFHFEALEIECQECHHEINAAQLITPHDEYFSDFWIDCNICHNGNESSRMEAQACSDCHRTLPHNIADETLSAKVVIHKNCWNCHEVGTGEETSESCSLCHTGEKKNNEMHIHIKH